MVTMAYSGYVQVPVKRARPVNVAIGTLVGSITADWICPSFEEAALFWFEELDCVAVAAEAENLLASEGEHPR